MCPSANFHVGVANVIVLFSFYSASNLLWYNTWYQKRWLGAKWLNSAHRFLQPREFSIGTANCGTDLSNLVVKACDGGHIASALSLKCNDLNERNIARG